MPVLIENKTTELTGEAALATWLSENVIEGGTVEFTEAEVACIIVALYEIASSR